MQHRRRIRLLRRFVLGLAVAAIVAPAAQARIPDQDTSVLRGAEVRPADGSDGVVLRRSRPAVLVQGEHKADLPKGAYVPFVSDFPRTSPAPGGEEATPAGYRRALPQDYGVIQVEVVRSPSTFDWGDALIGAGGTLALLLLAGGASLATRRRTRPAAA